MRNRRIIGSILALSISFALTAQDIVDAFISMPNEYYLSLPSAQREELVKAYNEAQTHKGDSISTERKNKFRGKSSITLIDTVHQKISVKNSNNGKVDLKVLSSELSNDVKYYALIFTACAPICNSHIGFYNSNWKLLNFEIQSTTTIFDFLDIDKIKADNKDVKIIAEKFDIVFIEIQFVENENSIKTTLNSGNYLDKENYEKLKSYLKGDKILYTWKNDKYIIDKCYW